MNIDEYAAWIPGKKPTMMLTGDISGFGPITGLAGRLIRGKVPADFVSLTDDPSRKVVMLVDGTGLANFIGKTGYEMLISVGYPADDIARYVNGGTKFKLVVFPAGGAVKLATWDNVISVAEEAYPQFAGFFADVLPELKSTPFSDFETRLILRTGKRFMEVKKNGSSDPYFMTPYKCYALMASSIGTSKKERAFIARSFLYFVLNMNELFSGDGHTYDSAGKRGVAEYLVANKPLVELGDHRGIDIPVILP